MITTTLPTTTQPAHTITHLTGAQGNAMVALTGSSEHIIVIEGDSQINLDYTTDEVGATTIVRCLCLATTDTHITLTLNGTVQHDDTSIELHIVTLYGEGGSAHIDGKVSLMPGGVKMHGELLEENIILGKQAKIKTLPMLDVHTSEVTAGHGARIEKLDAKKLFYLKSRGLDESQATQMMIGGYIESIFEGVEESDEVQGLKEYSFQKILSSL